MAMRTDIYAPTDKVNQARLARAYDLLLRFWDNAKKIGDKYYPVDASALHNIEDIRNFDRVLKAGEVKIFRVKQHLADIKKNPAEISRVDYFFVDEAEQALADMKQFVQNPLIDVLDLDVQSARQMDYLKQLAEQFENDVDLTKRMQPRIVAMGSGRNIG